jgi:hypothetical protein
VGLNQFPVVVSEAWVKAGLQHTLLHEDSLPRKKLNSVIPDFERRKPTCFILAERES